MNKKRNVVEWAMHYRQMVILVVTCLVAFGVYSLPKMRKNEFPDFTVRQGVVVAVAPGNTSEEMEQQVAKPLEDYIFTYKEVKKQKTYSMSRDGIVYVMVELNDDVNNKDEFWSKFKHGVQTFKQTGLPQNVMAVVVNDDFGDTSALLITMESEEKTYRELSDLMDRLQDRLRPIESVGRMTVSGMEHEQISVTLDQDRLSKYGLSDTSVGLTLMQKGFSTTGGRIKSAEYTSPIHVERSLNTLYDVEQQIVFSSPAGNVVRLKDVADVRRTYPEPTSHISNNGKKCLLLSVEMKKGQNVVQMGQDIDRVMASFEQTLPKEVSVYRITDQSKVVGDSVANFLQELVIAIVAVIIVVMLLLPMRVALVAASTIPISIFISLGLYNAFGIELNTVTLAALIVTLGMIVDNSIVIIDNYLEQIGEGKSRWNASISSTTHFFKSIFSATMAISITFFPFLITCKGMLHDFLLSFPWAITIVLAVSLAVATLLVPFMQFWFIRKPIKGSEVAENAECSENSENSESSESHSKKHFSFLALLQRYYDKLLDACFRWPKTTLAIGVGSIVLGVVMMGSVPQQLMPTAERNQLAVEIYLPTGTPLKKTSLVADSLEHLLRQDKRIVSVTSFKGCSSPRFHTAYAPQIAGENYAQFIVNTTDDKATIAVLDDYTERWANLFPEAIVKFKQMSHNVANCPIEVRLSGQNVEQLQKEADRLVALMHTMPELQLVRTNFFEPQTTTTIRLKEDEAARLGVSNAQLEMTLALRYGSGVGATTLWEGDKAVSVVLKSLRSDSATVQNLLDEPIPVLGGLRTVPLRQVAEVVPSLQHGQRVRRNGVPTITVMADLKRGQNSMAVTKKLQDLISEEGRVKNEEFNSSSSLKKQTNWLSPSGSTCGSSPSTLHSSLQKDSSLSTLHSSLTFGGDYEDSNEKMGPVLGGLAIAAVMIFFILLIHFRRIALAVLVFASMLLSLLGAAVGIMTMQLAFSVTCVLGLVSLMGIIVRNGIIMFDYAEELRTKEKMNAREAIHHSASRRMRPIFLTSAAASMGVIPMILGGSGLWMPMGSVICFGTLISMVFILTVVPIAYLMVFEGTEAKRLNANKLEQE